MKTKASRIAIEDVLFWTMVIATIGLGLWMLFGSPTEIQSIITLSIFFGSCGLMLWKYVFSIDKKSTVGFMKVKHDIEKMRIEMNKRFDKIEKNINDRFDKIEVELK